MKRRELVKHLENHGCRPLREGKKHSVFYNPRNRKTSTIPRHAEIVDLLAKKI